MVAALRERCVEVKDPACNGVERSRGVVWVKPSVVVEVQYDELIQGRLRNAVLPAPLGPKAADAQ